MRKSLQQQQQPLKGKVNYNVQSKIDTGIRKSDDLYSSFMSPKTTERGRMTTAMNSRVGTSQVSVFYLRKTKIL